MTQLTNLSAIVEGHEHCAQNLKKKQFDQYSNIQLACTDDNYVLQYSVSIYYSRISYRVIKDFNTEKETYFPKCFNC